MQTNETTNANTANQTKTRIYNLIILDKSGSMGSIRTAAYQGCNEVLGGIRAAALERAEVQEQLVSLLLFDTQSMPYIYKMTRAADTHDLSQDDYQPCAATPLYDAMGMALTELEHEVDRHEDAVGMVTVITDGYENASREYTGRQIHEMVGRLKEKGWNFSFMGANQDVEKVCVDLNINIGNACKFEFSDDGMRESWRRHKEANNLYYARMADVKRQSGDATKEERRGLYCSMNSFSSFFNDLLKKDDPEQDRSDSSENGSAK